MRSISRCRRLTVGSVSTRSLVGSEPTRTRPSRRGDLLALVGARGSPPPSTRGRGPGCSVSPGMVTDSVVSTMAARVASPTDRLRERPRSRAWLPAPHRTLSSPGAPLKRAAPSTWGRAGLPSTSTIRSPGNSIAVRRRGHHVARRLQLVRQLHAAAGRRSTARGSARGSAGRPPPAPVDAGTAPPPARRTVVVEAEGDARRHRQGASGTVLRRDRRAAGALELACSARRVSRSISRVSAGAGSKSLLAARVGEGVDGHLRR